MKDETNCLKIEGQIQKIFSRSFGAREVNSFFVRLLCLLTFWSYLAIWTTGFLRSLISILVFPLAVVAFRGRRLFSNAAFVHVFSAMVLVYAIWESMGPIPGVIVLLRFASVILILQLLIVDSNRSANGVQILCLMIILAVAAMNVNFLFPMVVIPFLLTFYRSLGEMSLIKHKFNSGFSPTATVRLRETLSHALASSAVSIAFFALFWLVIFYVIPRTESFGLASETSRRRLRGFGNTLSIGDSGLLEDNPAVIMRVRPLEDKSLTYSVIRRIRNKVLRGATFSTYQNGTWERGTKRRWLVDVRRNQGEFELIKRDGEVKELHSLEFILENNDPPVIFIPDNTVSVNFSTPFISMEDDQSFYFYSRKQANRRYVANVLHDPIEPVDQRVDELVLEKRVAKYAGISGISSDVVELANKIASGTITISERVNVLVDFLQENCTYSLNQLPTSRDPIEDFLFHSRSGTCEHFASAFAILLRCVGIPARPVGGYTFGEWNEIGVFFTVRQRHAHAWVEVYYPQSGWVPVDPTPASEESGYETEVGRLFQSLWDAYEGYWFTYVYNFDNKTQMVGYRKISGSFDTFFEEVLPGSFSPVILFSLLLFVVLFVASILLRRRFKNKESWIPESYRLWELKMPIKRFVHETPGEFHCRLMSSGYLEDEAYASLKEAAMIIDEIAFSGTSEINDLELRLEKKMSKVLFKEYVKEGARK